MKVTALDPMVLTGQGGGGSFSVGVPNATPGVGPTGGDAGAPDLAVPIDNPGDGNNAEASEPLPAHVDSGGPGALAAPAPSPVMPTHPPGGNEPHSHYSTIGPVPKG